LNPSSHLKTAFPDKNNSYYFCAPAAPSYTQLHVRGAGRASPRHRRGKLHPAPLRPISYI